MGRRAGAVGDSATGERGLTTEEGTGRSCGGRSRRIVPCRGKGSVMAWGRAWQWLSEGRVVRRRRGIWEGSAKAC